MERFFQLKRKSQPSSSSSTPESPMPNTNSNQANELVGDDNIEKNRSQFNLDDLVSDPGKRPSIESYDPNIRDDVRMAYLEKGPCQPHGHDFPRRRMGNDNRCFRKEWFSEFYWLEYSIEKDAAYCLYCYLFKPDRGGQGGGYVFTKTGFRDWRHKKTLRDHVGLVDSVHNQAFNKCTMLMNQKQSISFALSSQSSTQQRSYRTRLTAILDCTRFLLMQGLAFRGNDETKESVNRGNLIELLEWYAARCEEVSNAVFSNAPGNDQIMSSSIQKDLISCCAVETTKIIMKEMGDSLFSILKVMQEFEFVFCLHFMLRVLVITNDLSQALQKKDQDIQNAMNLLDLCKYALQNMRDNGWDDLLNDVIEFCVDKHIIVPNMEDIVVMRGRPRRGAQQVTYYHRFFVNLYCHVIDSILQELNDRFPETTTELLLCISCLRPKASFAAFDRAKLLRLAQFYPLDFTCEDLVLLKPQLDKFLILVTRDKNFFNLNSISHLAQKLVETENSCYFPLVYRLITLILILPVATASVERAFSAMNLIKSDLRNKMGDDWLNDSLVVYTERKIFKLVENEAILQRFQSMRPRRLQLSELTATE